VRPVGSLAVVVAAAALVSGCSTSAFLGEPSETAQGRAGAEAGAPPAARCKDLLTPSPEARFTSVNVLLVDGSASGFTRPETTWRVDWASVLEPQLPRAGNGLVHVGLFGGDVDWQPPKATPGESRDQARTENDRKDARACLVGDLSRVLETSPRKPQTDILRALAEGADQVRGLPGPKSIYLATDGLSNTGCADLRGADIGDLTAIPAIVRSCGPELPRLGPAFHVRMFGLGNSADGWPDVKTPQRTWLIELWRQLCTATGATCDEPEAAAPGSVPVVAGRRLADAAVEMPGLKIVRGNPTVLTVPASILFDLGSAELATGRSKEAVQQVLAFLRGLSHRRIVINGHTDSTGTPDRNRELSRDRAEAVRGALAAQGVKRLTAKGYAALRPACTPEYRNGEPDRIAMACNRRVEIVIYT
jgi:OOP family OmpA-OmpF porin